MDKHKLKRPVAKCIFCVTRWANSKEHSWPKWLHSHLPQTHPKTVYMTRATDADPWDVSYPIRGAPKYQTMQVVCKECNGTWMSVNQNRAMPLLKPYVQRRHNPWDEKSQQTAALWATIFTMVIEYRDPKTIAATQEERSYVYRNNMPPADWRIYVCRLRNNEAADWMHTGCVLDFGDMGIHTMLLTMIYFGSIGLVVMHLARPNQDAYEAFDEGATKGHFSRIWPVSLEAVYLTKRMSLEQYIEEALACRSAMFGDLDGSPVE